jgi:2'-5' RNA ligase
MEPFDPCERNRAERINSFALVAYIPSELGGFLDDLRRELVPGCLPRAHVTILPPRPLFVLPEEAWAQLSSALRDFAAFEVQLGSVEMFETTSVIYVGLRSGRRELEQMHEALGAGDLGFSEPFQYHPHVTLAQDLAPEDVEAVYGRAARRWNAYGGPRSFAVETVTFVQNTDHNRWLDLAQYTLGVPSVR